MEMLKCTKCKNSKFATLEFFPPHNKKLNGFDSWCRACRSSYRSSNCRGRFRNVISDEDLIKLKNSRKCCAICKKETNLVVDHDHKSGKVRDMLCNHCNRGLGHFLDDPILLQLAAQYLKNHFL
jgi:uncharacterized protein YbaR (Trm112 family)